MVCSSHCHMVICTGFRWLDCYTDDMKAFIVVLLAGSLLTSCAYFAYGTGRFNPIVANFDATFEVKPGDLNHVSATLPASSVAAVMPAPLTLYNPSSAVRAASTRTLTLREARWRAWTTPASWGVSTLSASMELETRQRLGSVWDDRFEVLTDLRATRSMFNLTVRLPMSTTPGTYLIEGQAQLTNSSPGITVQIKARVPSESAATPLNREYTIQPASSSDIDVRPGGTYTLRIPLAEFDAQRQIQKLAPFYLESAGSSDRDLVKLRTDDWRANLVALPQEWDFETLDKSLELQLNGQRSSLSANQIRTLYTTAYSDLNLLFGLKAKAGAANNYLVAGQLEYRGAKQRDFQWNVTLRP
jgi:hypothetical protein